MALKQELNLPEFGPFPFLRGSHETRAAFVSAPREVGRDAEAPPPHPLPRLRIAAGFGRFSIQGFNDLELVVGDLLFRHA